MDQVYHNPAQNPSQNPQGEVKRRFDFLTFTPVNEKARLAFNNLVQRKDNLQKHHSRYIVVTGKENLIDTTGHAVRPGEETPEHPSTGRPENPIVSVGYFGVGFDRPAILKGAKWIVGRGSSVFGADRRVDLLLANPNDGEATRGLASAHALLKMHPVSGAWMLQAGQERNSSFALGGGTNLEQFEAMAFITDHLLRNGQVCCLYKESRTLEVCGMQYIVKYTIDSSEKEKRYRDERNACLEQQSFPLPMTNLTMIPHPKDHFIEWAVYRKGLGSGGNAAVFEGIDPADGSLRVVKEITVKHEGHVPSVKREFDAHFELGDITNIVQIYASTTSEMDFNWEFESFPMKMYLVMEKGIPFDKYEWNAKNTPSWQDKLRLLGLLVEGLNNIHRRGWMHRDITIQNILLFPADNRPAFCDLGKAIKAKTHSSTNLAAMKFLPPEIEEGKNNQYDHKIDIWMLALALIWAWWKPVIQIDDHTELSPRRPDEYTSICETLKRDQESHFADIILNMFSWNPRDRPNEQQIIAQLERRLSAPQPGKSSERKRIEGAERKGAEVNKRSHQ